MIPVGIIIALQSTDELLASMITDASLISVRRRNEKRYIWTSAKRTLGKENLQLKYICVNAKSTGRL